MLTTDSRKTGETQVDVGEVLAGVQDPRTDRILILDFGAQYTQLIGRTIREIGTYCEIHPWDVDDEFIRNFGARGIVLSGGPASVTEGDEDTPVARPCVFELGVPVLGICYGMQTMAAQLGGEVETADHREYGYARLDVQGACTLFDELNDGESGEAALDVWMSHGDRVLRAPDGFSVVASTEAAPVAAIADAQRQFYGVQFHPEVTHTKQGREMLRRFVVDVCKSATGWNPGNIAESLITWARTEVGDDHVILGLSGGVDSSVAAALLNRAIGDRLTCIFVDNGLLRLNEAEQVMQTFGKNLGVRVIHVDASEKFLSRLSGVTDPEAKRKVIGETFIEVFDAESSKIDGVKWLAQGTIYPDVIESAGSKTGKAKVIKSHHNVGGLPDYMKLKLLEPLRELFKDEVRKLGVELGLASEMVYRHPFPGPGLGVRILGEVKAEYAEILRQADHIFISELRSAGWYDKVSQAFVVFLPVKSVGVVGDNRAYDYVVSLRSVTTVDFMTATWSHLPYDLLERVSSRIMNEVRGVSRVAYDISSKPPATIEWE